RSGYAIALAALVWAGATLPADARRHRQEHHPQALTAETVNAARYEGPASARQPSAVVLKAAGLLDRLSFSPRAIDAKANETFTKAPAAFQQAQGLTPTGKLDSDTWERLAGNSDVPALVDYQISDDDVKGPFTPHIPKKMEEMSRLDHLDYTGPVELLAEK